LEGSWPLAYDQIKVSFTFFGSGLHRFVALLSFTTRSIEFLKLHFPIPYSLLKNYIPSRILLNQKPSVSPQGQFFNTSATLKHFCLPEYLKMVSFLILTVALFFVSPAFAVNFRKSCHNVSLPFTVTSTNFIYGGSPFAENVDFTAFVQDYNRRDFLTSFVSFSGAPQAETATYTIAGTFCEPFTGSSTVLVATHGGTYDRS
jgi:hypothetical protein